MPEVTGDQAAVDLAYSALDDEVVMARDHLAAALRDSLGTGTAQSRSERDALAAAYGRRLRDLAGVEAGLVFGRIDTEVDRHYIGRIGLRSRDRSAALIDWRAQAAEPFYRATAAMPGDVRRRRHVKVSQRRVVTVHDDLVTDVREAVADAADAALLEAINTPRTDRMRDIVTTIQAEQDRIIRSPLPGVLVVQGGPGTGKTAVALHRVAYLLHRHRERLERSGVLLLGPNTRFLSYIADVLPALGETSVVTTTVDELLPGVTVDLVEADHAAILKGDVDMAEVLRAAVQSIPRPLESDLPLEVDGTTVWLRASLVTDAQAQARATGEPHNTARETFARLAVDDLLHQLVDAHGVEHDGTDARELARTLHATPAVRREINLLWMPRTPEQVLRRLWSDPGALARSAPHLDRRQLETLHRPAAGWSAGDVPLLDELRDLLGPMPPTPTERQGQLRQQQDIEERLAYAADALSGLGLDTMISADQLAERFAETGSALSLAERAQADPNWTYGHVVVDEAQELSAMAWRMVFRRCPMRSMTIVGDTNQTGSPAGVDDFAAALATPSRGRWRLERLTVNYRTPGAIMDTAVRVLDPRGRREAPTRSLRRGNPPAVHSLDRPPEPSLTDWRHGTTAVVVPNGARCPQVAEWLRQLPGEAPVRSVQDVKGLEFDHVVVVEPAAFLDIGPRGANDLYVALTRATQHVTLVHDRPLPPELLSAHETR